MTLPHFIGIGAQKAGTSWLHAQLVQHPQIYMPRARKEVHYFDRYYDRGHDWYKKWFKPGKISGEITPDYLYEPQAAARIHNLCPDAKLIVILREPVSRAYSHYRMNFQSGRSQNYANFDDFMTRDNEAFCRGLYADHLSRYFDLFKREQCLVLFYEELFNQPNGAARTFQQIGDFLKIDHTLFDVHAATHKIGAARLPPRYRWLGGLAQTMRDGLRDYDLDHVAYHLKRLGIHRGMLGAGRPIPPLSSAYQEKWAARYAPANEKLADLLGKNLSLWGDETRSAA